MDASRAEKTKRRMSPRGTSFGSGRSGDGAMASGPPDVMDHQEPAEAVEECSAKKKSKFQTFKKFFARKKRKEPPAAGAEAGLKASRSSDNVSKTSQNDTLTRSEEDKGSGSKTSLGSKALSHDSVFVSDTSESHEALGASQDNVHGKVKSLQLQLRQAIRLGSPPSLLCVKTTDDAGALSEDDDLPCSPRECAALHTVTNQAERNSFISLVGVDSDSDQPSSRAVSPLVVPGDFSQPASPFGCLDNSAAKHKLGLRLKAGNRRKPAARLEMGVEGDSAVEEVVLNSSATEAAEQRAKTTEVVSGDELKPTGDREEEEEEDEQPQHSRHSLLRNDEEEREEGEDQSQAEPDVSHDTSSPPELRLSEEEAPEARSSSRDPSLDSPGALPAPPAGSREYLLDPQGVASGAEERGVESDLALSGEEDGLQENGEEEEESSFLQEVLSSLKTPLASRSLAVETEGVVLEEEEGEDVEVEEGEEVKEEEEEEEEAAMDEPAGSLLSCHTADEEEEEEQKELATLSTASCRDVEEEEGEGGAEEEELVVEQVCQHDREEDGEEEEAEQVAPEERDDIETRNAVHQAEEEEEESEGEEEARREMREEEEVEEAITLEKEPEVEEEEEEGQEKREKVEVEEAAGRVEEAEQAIEEERETAEERTETFPDAADEEVAMLPPQQEVDMEDEEDEEDEGVDVVVGDETVRLNDSKPEPSPAASDRRVGEKREGGEEEVEVETEGESESERRLQQEGVKPSEGRAPVLATPPLSLPEPRDEAPSLDGGTITPSKTGTTSIHINLLSPSSEKATPFFQPPPAAEGEAPGHAAAEEEEEPADDVEAAEEDGRSAPEGEEAPPASERGEANRPIGGPDQSKAQATIAPSRQRSPSAGEAGETAAPPLFPPAASGVEAEHSKDPAEAEPASSAKAELALSPGRGRSAGAAAPPTDENAVVVDGNADSPFGVRLRKTSALHLFSSEEENTEPPVEPPAQPTSCRVDSQQPIGVKPSMSIKPALSKKPDGHGDSGGKNKRTSDPAPVCGGSGGSGPPSWISMAKQKQKIYKENSLDEITVKKDETERKTSLPLTVSSAAGREHSNRTVESTGKVEISKHSTSVDKEARRSRFPPTPVPPHPLKSQSLPVPAKASQLPPATSKHPPHPTPPQRPLSPPAPIPTSQKSPSSTSPPPPTKTATSSKPQSPPPFTPAKPVSRAPGLPSQTPASQRGLPPPASPQDEPPWMALAKKKAKAWSEMPQIVQ
ncbi:CRACD-like protein isoform X1 [Pseudoliparis swirei]|uniref:CRACD-like protein isoform X1 n=2 Tax=Pseudoliparis swirei TaxID=2059687 RepID=UPI0024BE954B|nr:CRACD-like protein isoform X1 [Pseudoliparis swirei]